MKTVVLYANPLIFPFNYLNIEKFPWIILFRHLKGFVFSRFVWEGRLVMTSRGSD